MKKFIEWIRDYFRWFVGQYRIKHYKPAKPFVHRYKVYVCRDYEFLSNDGPIQPYSYDTGWVEAGEGPITVFHCLDEELENLHVQLTDEMWTHTNFAVEELDRDTIRVHPRKVT